MRMAIHFSLGGNGLPGRPLALALVVNLREGSMGHVKALFLILAATLCANAVPAVQKRPEAISRNQVQSDDAFRILEKTVYVNGQPQRAKQLTWQSALSDAVRLHSLSEQIREQLGAGPHQLPAGLNQELKEVEKLAKHLRQELQL